MLKGVGSVRYQTEQGGVEGGLSMVVGGSRPWLTLVTLLNVKTGT